jgi:hypothetical protein
VVRQGRHLVRAIGMGRRQGDDHDATVSYSVELQSRATGAAPAARRCYRDDATAGRPR